MAGTDPRLAQLDPSIRDNVARMIDDAKRLYNVVIHVNQTQRTPQQAQTFHILHMYLHNYFFPHRKPKFVAADGRTIKWEHLKDPNVKWVLIDDVKRQFLRSRDGLAATLMLATGGNRKWLVEPDKVASTQAMSAYLKSHGVASMAAPGVDGCGEPCRCGGHASKHVSGKACDLSGLERLGAVIRGSGSTKYSTTDEAVDHFLHGYHLWRPLAHLKGKQQELWHVEALPPQIQKSPKPTHAAHGHHDAVHARLKGQHGC